MILFVFFFYLDGDEKSYLLRISFYLLLFKFELLAKQNTFTLTESEFRIEVM